MGAQTHIRNANARHVRELAAPTQRKARPQDGRPNAKLIRNENVHTREHEAKRRAGRRIRTNFGLEVDFLIRPHQGWAPQRNARHVRKMGAQTQRKARPQVARPNAKQGTSASWVPQRTSATQSQGTSASSAPQRNARHVRKMGAQTQRKARPQVGRPNAKQGTSASWAPQRTSATQTQGTSARPQVGRPNATQGTFARWAPKRNARRVRKTGAQTKNSSATKTSTQVSTRLKDEMEDG